MINIYAPINLLGYGIHANNLIKALIDEGADINLTKIGQVQNDPYFEAYWKKAEERKMEYDAKCPSVFIFHDELSNQMAGTPAATFSVFESDKIHPLSKVMLVNGPAEIILVTTQRHKEILSENGIGKRIEVVNEGVDDAIFNTIPTDKLVDTKKFTFITMGKKEKRKNTSMIVKSFINTMKGKEVALIAHTFNPFANTQKDHPFKNLACWSDVNPLESGFQYKGWQGKFHLFSDGKCDIYFTAPGIQTAEMGCLYHSANVGIQISRGEGWDLPLTEMLACGLPAIATNCLGHSEYLSGAPEEQKKLVLEMTGKELANDGIWFKGNKGSWETITNDVVEQKLTEVYENREKYNTKSEEISAYISENYNWSKAAQALLEVVK